MIIIIINYDVAKCDLLFHRPPGESSAHYQSFVTYFLYHDVRNWYIVQGEPESGKVIFGILS